MGFVVGVQDEATFGLIPIIQQGWARKGSKPVVLVNQKNECINVFGARTKKCFVFSFAKRKTQNAFVAFLKKLTKRMGHILLFADNAKAHHGKKVNEFIKAHKKTFRLEYFLKYTPELNPTEPCWKPAKKAIANRVIKTIPAMQYHLRKTFKREEDMPKMFHYLRD